MQPVVQPRPLLHYRLPNCKARSVTQKSPRFKITADINGAVDDLAKLHKVNATEKKRALLNGWLWSGIQNNSLDLSVCAGSVSGSGEPSDDLIR